MAIESLGRMLIYIGVIVVLIGGFFVLSAKLPWIGRLPGDIMYRRENLTVLVPITTMIIASIVLTVLLNFIIRR